MADPIAETLANALVQALRQLGEAGRPEVANRIAAIAWSGIRRADQRIADRLNGVMHLLARLEEDRGGGKEHQMTQEPVLDVRSQPPVRRHSLILDTFDALAPGAAFELRNDHDPKPLYYQFAAEQQGTFTWEYLEEGPEVWRVRIGRTQAA